jgi:hypothetical protein
MYLYPDYEPTVLCDLCKEYQATTEHYDAHAGKTLDLCASCLSIVETDEASDRQIDLLAQWESEREGEFVMISDAMDHLIGAVAA